MNVEWLVAKYIPDLRRREPRNVGVILRVGDRLYARFQGEGKPGGAAYQGWVEHWRRCIELGNFESLTHTRAGDSYYVEPSGERLVGTQEVVAEEFLDELFALLVATPPRSKPLTTNTL